MPTPKPEQDSDRCPVRLVVLIVLVVVLFAVAFVLATRAGGKL